MRIRLRELVSPFSRRALAAILAVLVALLSVAVVWIHAPTPVPKRDYLGIWVNTTADVSWELNLPLPIEQNGTPWYLVSSLELVEGEANASVADTTLGPALHIEGKGYARFYVTTTARGTLYATVVPQNLTRTGGELKTAGFLPCMVYAGAGGHEEDLRFSVSMGAHRETQRPHRLITVLHAHYGDLKAGWQELYADQGFIFED